MVRSGSSDTVLGPIRPSVRFQVVLPRDPLLFLSASRFSNCSNNLLPVRITARVFLEKEAAARYRNGGPALFVQVDPERFTLLRAAPARSILFSYLACTAMETGAETDERDGGETTSTGLPKLVGESSFARRCAFQTACPLPSFFLELIAHSFFARSAVVPRPESFCHAAASPPPPHVDGGRQRRPAARSKQAHCAQADASGWRAYQQKRAKRFLLSRFRRRRSK